MNEMTIEQLEERAAAIDGISTAEMTDAESVKALADEREAINAELESRKQKAAEEAEKRQAIADGETPVTIVQTFEEERKMTFGIDTPEYRNAWLKNLMGQTLTAEERTGMDSSANSAGYAIPTETMNKIVTNMVQIAPLLAEVDVMHIPSNVTLPIENSIGNAAIHSENAAINVASDNLNYLTLTGYEICKTLPISAKVSAMAIPAFENWVVEQISRKMAELIENYIVNGTGSSQPKGLDYSATWTDGTNAVDYAAADPTVAELEELISYQNAAYIQNAKFLCNWKTFWAQIHPLRDDKNEPVCVRENGTYYVFGFPVVFSSKVDDGDLFFGDLKEAVKANFVQDINVEASAAAGFASNSVLYKGACIFDCSTVAGRVVKGAANP